MGSIHKSIQTTGGHIERGGAAFKLNVASAESVSVSDMERGMGGRLEEAFETAKAKGEAAFVAFITAGYPSKEGVLFTDLLGFSSIDFAQNQNLTSILCFDVPI